MTSPDTEMVQAAVVGNAGQDAAVSVRRWMLREADAVRQAAHRLTGPEVGDVLELLEGCTRLVTTVGTGVSGTVAHKLAAAFSSSGTPSVFLHASDALHGMLGVVRPGDVAVVVSNSGHTEETLRVVEHLRAASIPVIALTGDITSPLARAADAVLDASVDAEACPLNALPTASSTVALALGDALAVTLAERRRWSHADLAQSHPAGVLGRTAREYL
ncbi:SIS domain-containing protein [Streptomyces sp. H27-S2]|uniref:SIS domain-containing protein n=1 Tax=Streptomyces antarcticus TaxID=2996458 RepID=UPI00226E26AD|nr:SIS domain-containing protein [Streptomyces sp. H27-S2]MCY0950461.1 SIS domain-containing protein [Streptomyces sp. H27-S2]